jgi:hypothetical protein
MSEEAVELEVEATLVALPEFPLAVSNALKLMTVDAGELELDVIFAPVLESELEVCVVLEPVPEVEVGALLESPAV